MIARGAVLTVYVGSLLLLGFAFGAGVFTLLWLGVGPAIIKGARLIIGF